MNGYAHYLVGDVFRLMLKRIVDLSHNELQLNYPRQRG